MISLKSEQENNLVNIITETMGTTLDKCMFIENVLQMFEDIAGFESLDDCELQFTLTNLWKIYNDQYRK